MIFFIKNKVNIFAFTFVFCFFNISLFSQSGGNKPTSGGSSKKFVDPREAKEHFNHRNYLWALPVYRQLVKQEPNNPEYLQKLGLCYLNTNINKSLAIPYLEKAGELTTLDKTVYYNLGLAYQYTGRFDDAIATYNRYLKGLAPGKEKEKVSHQIETCDNGKELIQYPVDAVFENLGSTINSEFPDYYPFVSLDETNLVFTSRRKGNLGGSVEVDGYYSSDIYMSTRTNGAWEKPKNVGGPINTRYDEQCVFLSPDGKSIFIYMDRIDSLGNIYESNFSEKEKTYKKMTKLNSNINSDFETSGSISPDGKTIFFASKRATSLGETDIYMARKLPNGDWGLPQNLGKKINTQYKEDFPEIAPDGKTLYFSSEGHNSMGDFDLFKSVWNEDLNTWTTPENLGYPVNSVREERCITFTKDNRVAYISAVRDGGFGDLDIYKVTFPVEKFIIVKGNISSNTNATSFPDVLIAVEDLKNKDMETNQQLFTPNLKTGQFIMTLKPGKYHISITAKGYRKNEQDLNISNEANPEIEIIKKFILVQ